MEVNSEILLRVVQRNEINTLKNHIKKLEASGSFNLNKIFRKSTGDTLVHIASTFGNVNILRYLVEEKGCSVNQENSDGKIALHDASQFSKLECLQFLLEQGSNVNAVKKADWTPLMLACTKSDFSIVETLLRHGADPAFCNKDGWNCFHLACRVGNIKIVQLLFDNQDLICCSSHNGRSPIHTAVMHGNLEVVEFILEKHPCQVSAVDNCGTNCAMESCRFGFANILKILVDHGADLLVLNKAGQSVLHIAAEAGQKQIVRLLVTEYSFDVNSVGANGMTSLHYAVKEDQVETVMCLLELGAFLDLKDNQGRRCIDLAIALKKRLILNSNILGTLEEI